jgi:hypothetical protein
LLTSSVERENRSLSVTSSRGLADDRFIVDRDRYNGKVTTQSGRVTDNMERALPEATVGVQGATRLAGDG